MRYCILALLLTLSTGAFAQDLDCKKFKNGTFKSSDPNPEIGNFIITRKGKNQTEYSEVTGLKMRLKVKWVDQCTYTLIFDKILENPKNADVDFSKDHIMTIKIIETKPNSYIQRTTSNLYDMVLESELVKIK